MNLFFACIGKISNGGAASFPIQHITAVNLRSDLFPAVLGSGKFELI